MVIERSAGMVNMADVLDRVLDKGIVIDAWVRVSLVGIDLVTVEAQVVVASIATYLQYSDVIGQAGGSTPSQPMIGRVPWTVPSDGQPRRTRVAKLN